MGPGRYVGRSLLVYGPVEVLLTIFEIDNDTGAHDLRIVLYTFKGCQTIEYRLSSLERIMIFNDQSPLIDQILGKLKHVYCDVTNTSSSLDKHRTLLLLDEDTPPLPSSSSVWKDFEEEEGEDDEYDILVLTVCLSLDAGGCLMLLEGCCCWSDDVHSGWMLVVLV